jgi:hypothetical protein
MLTYADRMSAHAEDAAAKLAETQSQLRESEARALAAAVEPCTTSSTTTTSSSSAVAELEAKVRQLQAALQRID